MRKRTADLTVGRIIFLKVVADATNSARSALATEKGKPGDESGFFVFDGQL